MLIVIHGQQVG